MPAENHLLTSNADIAFWDEGDGDTVLLVHASFGADWFAPLTGLLPGYRVVRAHRAGYGRSRDLSGRLNVADHALHLADVLQAQGIEQAHVVGHSSGAVLALQLAVTRPRLVRSMVLLESARPYAPGEPKSDAVCHAVAAAEAGDLERAFDLFLGSVCAPGYQDAMIRALGAGGFRASVLSGRYFFAHERAAFAAWDADAVGLEALRQPTLLVAGGEVERLNNPFQARNRALAGRLADAQSVTLPGVSHAMPLENPALVARTVLDFVRRHPIDSAHACDAT
ncbi:alpha/beta hydrolase [Actinacidiphila glaucinigra]|uniref:alpha/beta fold hydrolase n=1 Tax=Actinacidiphila glaucinigra TaxID=235986 RepID=UPI0033A1F3AE